MSIDSTKTRILEAAGPIFAARGFRGATVRDICARAEVNLAAVNYYFRDKDNLYRETVRYARKTRELQHPFPDRQVSASAEEKLQQFVRILLQRLNALQEPNWQIQLIMYELLHPTEACREMVQQYFFPMFNKLTDIIQELHGTALAEDVKQKLGFSIIGQCLFYRIAKPVARRFIGDDAPSDFDVEQLAAHISQFSISAIQSRFWAQSAI